MSQYPKPTLHNGSLNTSFNTSDFSSTSKLNSTQVSGPLVVAGLGTFNVGLQVYGNQNITGGLVASSATISSTLTLPSTQAISSSITLVDTTSTQSISGAKSMSGGLTLGTSSTLTLPSTQAISSSITLVDTTSTQSIGGAKTISSGLTIGTSATLTLPSTQAINSTITLLDTTSSQSISGVKIFSTIITANGGVQLPIPTALTASATPTVNCLNYTNGAFTMTMSANITRFTFSNPRSGGQYTIFLTGGASAFTIAVTLTGTPAIKTNYATAVSVPISGKAVLTAYYDGTNMFISASVYA